MSNVLTQLSQIPTKFSYLSWDLVDFGVSD